MFVEKERVYVPFEQITLTKLFSIHIRLAIQNKARIFAAGVNKLKKK